MIYVNLIPPERLRRRRAAARLRQWSAACVIYTSILAAGVLLVRATCAPPSDDLAAGVAAMDQRLEAERLRERSARQELIVLESKLSAGNSVEMQPDWSILLRALGRRAGARIVLNRISVAPVGQTPAPVGAGGPPSESKPIRKVGYECLLAGMGLELGDVSRFVLALESSGAFDEVVLLGSRKRKFRDRDVVAFEARCVLRDAPEGGAP